MENNKIIKNVSSKDFTWDDWYELSEKYYEHYGNINVPFDFKTLNGYEYDENGYALGRWISIQRQGYKQQGNFKITPEHIEKLENFKIIWSVQETNWEENYKLLKLYYEHHGTTRVPTNFKTKNGYEYDEEGVDLYNWMCKQQKLDKLEDLNETQKYRKSKLDEISMEWRPSQHILKQEWEKNYALAEKYYKYYGNLLLPTNFKTINGYDYDEKGYALGRWINTQRVAYQGNDNHKIEQYQIDKLNAIGMIWNVKEYQFITTKFDSKTKYKKRYKLLNRFKKLLDDINENDNSIFTSKQDIIDINQKFSDSLDSSKRNSK